MLLPLPLITRSDDPSSATPPPCKPFTLHSNVCVGDLVAIIACSIAGVGFFFWAIHAIRKMRHDPFKEAEEAAEAAAAEEAERRRKAMDPYHDQSGLDNSLLVQQGLVQTPNVPQQARTANGYYSYGYGYAPGTDGYMAEYMGEGYPIGPPPPQTPRQSPATRPILHPSSKRAAAARELAIIRGDDDYASYAPFEYGWEDVGEEGEGEEGRRVGGKSKGGSSRGKGKGSSLRRSDSVYDRGYGYGHGSSSGSGSGSSSRGYTGRDGMYYGRDYRS